MSQGSISKESKGGAGRKRPWAFSEASLILILLVLFARPQGLFGNIARKRV